VTYHLWASLDAIEQGTQNTTLGQTVMFPLLLADGNEGNPYLPDYLSVGSPVGLFIDASTDIKDGFNGDDCIWEGSFLFGQPNATTGEYDSQVTVAGTCQGTANFIIGGTGDFKCATGYEYFTDKAPDDDHIAFTVYYCSGCDSREWM